MPPRRPGCHITAQEEEASPSGRNVSSSMQKCADSVSHVDRRIETEYASGIHWCVLRENSCFVADTTGLHHVSGGNLPADSAESPCVKAGDEVNCLKGKCRGAQIEVFVDEKSLASFIWPSCQGGYVGLLAPSGAEADIRILRDSFLSSPLSAISTATPRTISVSTTQPIGTALSWKSRSTRERSEGPAHQGDCSYAVRDWHSKLDYCGRRGHR